MLLAVHGDGHCGAHGVPCSGGTVPEGYSHVQGETAMKRIIGKRGIIGKTSKIKSSLISPKKVI